MRECASLLYMTQPSNPSASKEAQRLRTVRALRVLDTEPEEVFDALTLTACEVFGTSCSAICLIDSDRVWFKSKAGKTIPGIKEFRRSIAFCGDEVIADLKVLCIEDATQHERYANSSFVKGPMQARFYAGAPIQDENGNLIGVISVMDTEPKQAQDWQIKALKHLAQAAMAAFKARCLALDAGKEPQELEPLTGLMNRPAFQKLLATRHREASSLNGQLGALFGQPELVCLMRIDLDGFKSFNEGLGHAAGDEVIKAVAEHLNKSVAKDEILARLEGDEFVVLMPNGSCATDAVAAAQRLINVASQNLRISNGRIVRASVSVGIACADPSKVSAEALFNQAGAALHHAKSDPHQRWSLFKEPVHLHGLHGAAAKSAAQMSQQQARSKAPISAFAPNMVSPIVQMAMHGRHTDHPLDRTDPNCPACIENAFAPFDFTMAFQPIIDVDDRSVFAYEALVRGKRGESAQSVLSRVNRRNRYAFDQKCRRMAIELAHKLKIGETGAALSVNFIPGTILDPQNSVQAAISAASKTGFPLRKLIFEMVESEEVVDPEHLKSTFEIYRRHGFLPAIGSFGASHANLNLLADFQPSILKIDRKLVNSIHQSKAKKSIVRNLMKVCQDLEIVPIAQGVEVMDEYNVLREMGIHLFQGHLFAAPEIENLPAAFFPD